jgi:hypothetical protein
VTVSLKYLYRKNVMKKVARSLQIESKVQALVKYELAASIPLAR